MLFTSLEFFLLLILVVPTSYLLGTRKRLQNAFLLGVSYLFYGWWDYRFLALIVASTLVDFKAARTIHQTPEGQPARKRWLLTSVGVNLGLLMVFKYFDFFSLSLLEATQTLGLKYDPILLDVILPVGISFYTFQTMSYTIDVYRNRWVPQESFLDFALFVAFFPQLVAGPIERAPDLIPQLARGKRANLRQFEEGIFLITYGLFLKVVVADGLAQWANVAFSNPNYPFLPLVVGVIAFALQIYGDFCGYSMIARGTARLLGVDLMRNFRTPYFSTDIQEFWRRWHVSLSRWLRDYLYITLGGNRISEVRTYVNLMLTMLLGGLWHGAGWNFVIWGGLHGGALAIHRFLTGRQKEPPPKGPLKRFGSGVGLFVFVCFTWIFFRAATFGDACQMIAGILSFRGGLTMTGLMGLLQIGVAIAVVLPLEWLFFKKDEELEPVGFNWKIQTLFFALAWVAITGGLDGDASFIYFQF